MRELRTHSSEFHLFYSSSSSSTRPGQTFEMTCLVHCRPWQPVPLLLAPGSRVYAWKDFGPLHATFNAARRRSVNSSSHAAVSCYRRHTRSQLVELEAEHNQTLWSVTKTPEKRHQSDSGTGNREVRWLKWTVRTWAAFRTFFATNC